MASVLEGITIVFIYLWMMKRGCDPRTLYKGQRSRVSRGAWAVLQDRFGPRAPRIPIERMGQGRKQEFRDWCQTVMAFKAQNFFGGVG